MNHDTETELLAAAREASELLIDAYAHIRDLVALSSRYEHRATATAAKAKAAALRVSFAAHDVDREAGRPFYVPAEAEEPESAPVAVLLADTTSERMERKTA